MSDEKNECVTDPIDRCDFGVNKKQFQIFTTLLNAPTARNDRLEKLLATKSPWDFENV
jgi:uncharacterized protein (DUF1778 family)